MCQLLLLHFQLAQAQDAAIGAKYECSSLYVVFVGFFFVMFFFLTVQDKATLSPKQKWKRSINNKDGFFTLQNPKSSLFLVATEVPGVLSAWKDPSQYVDLQIKAQYIF